MVLPDEISNNHYPGGMLQPGRNFSSNNYWFGFNGQEKTNEISGNGNHNTALFWEFDTRLVRRWNLDPKPQISISDYAAFANNPILYCDPLGDEVNVTHRKGFLGLGKKETLKYENGNLFNKDGTAYAGKVNGFLKKSVEALNDLSRFQEGSSMLSELQGSKNVYSIVQSENTEFVPDQTQKAYANQIATDPNPQVQSRYNSLKSAGVDLTGGSGGTIYFNPQGMGVWEIGGYKTRPSLELGHELFHGLDANRGLSDDRLEQGIKRSEWQAIYRENMHRQQMGIPLRTYYRSQKDTQGRPIQGLPPYMLTPGSTPILPVWYKR